MPIACVQDPEKQKGCISAAFAPPSGLEPETL